jgi:predicted CXXCH cytochrome family protein
MKLLHPIRNWRDGLKTARGKFLLFAGLLLAGFAARGDSVVNSVHNLSANGPGTIKAVSETDACIFCHTAHHSNGEQPLWNHSMSSVSNYVVYSSARLDSLNLTIPQPNGSSRLCLSCHDGTVALGDVGGGAIQMQNGVTAMPAGDAANLGTDLSSDHPISFVYDSALASRDPQIVDPSTLNGSVRLDSQGRLQCTACHNPHDDQFGDFLVMDNTGSTLCLACHQPGQWSGSAHAISSSATPAAIADRQFVSPNSKTLKSAASQAKKIAPTSIAATACGNCHVSHRAGSKSHLLLAKQPEDNCLVCHSGGPAKKNIALDFAKPSIHPITMNSESHSPTEDPINPPERHVVCTDCHNPHSATAAKAVAPNASGALANLTGVTSTGTIIKPLTREYELCFRCHADSIERGPATVPRQVINTNTRLEFSPANLSFHPVISIGKNLNSVPSLIAPWLVSSRMYCTDCHNSDSGPNAGGFGANGPHGSIYRPLLERNLALDDYQPETYTTYALCYKCHDRNVVLSNRSFPFHTTHVVNDRAACTTCHDSHGIATSQHLINFNTLYVTPNSLGELSYTSTGLFKGVCSLTCHGTDHRNAAY